MSNLLYVIGQIRPLESQLLNSNQLDRMVGAKTPLDAFRVMTELSYAQYFDDSTKPEDFEDVLQQGLQETKQKLVEGTDHHPGLFFIWGLADLNNLKNAFKVRLVQKAKDISDFSQSFGFSLLGDLSSEDLEKIVFHKTIPEGYPVLTPEKRESIEALIQEDLDIGALESLINEIYFDYFYELSRKLNHPFLRDLYQNRADIQNLKSLARYVLLRNSALPKKHFLKNGSWGFEDFKKITKPETLFKFLKSSLFGNWINLPEGTDPEESLLEIENGLEKAYGNFIESGQSGEINSIQVPIAYFYKRIQDAKRLKCIMFSKFQGIKSEDIYQTLKTLSL